MIFQGVSSDDRVPIFKAHYINEFQTPNSKLVGTTSRIILGQTTTGEVRATTAGAGLSPHARCAQCARTFPSTHTRAPPLVCIREPPLPPLLSRRTTSDAGRRQHPASAPTLCLILIHACNACERAPSRVSRTGPGVLISSASHTKPLIYRATAHRVTTNLFF